MVTIRFIMVPGYAQKICLKIFFEELEGWCVIET